MEIRLSLSHLQKKKVTRKEAEKKDSIIVAVIVAVGK